MSDVVGSILLVAITVSSFIGLGLLIASLPGPPDQLHASLKTEVHPGPDQLWGTGDEQIRIRHMFGESIDEFGSSVIITQNGVAKRISDVDLAFTDGFLDLGETWSYQQPMNFNDQITISFAVPHGGGSRLLSSISVVTGQTSCVDDETPPTAVFSQEPANLEALTGLSPLNVTAFLIDTCNPVDETANPTLEFNLGLGSPLVMTPQGGNVWTASIQPPVGGWATVATQTLNYQAKGMADVLGNVGNSAVASDYIEPIPPTRTYVDSAVNIIGTHTNLDAAKNPDDLNAAAILTEGPGGGTGGTVTLYGNTVVYSQDWESPDRAADGLNNKYAKYKQSVSSPLELSLPDAAPSSNQILRVVVKGSGYINNHVNDGWQLNACTAGGCTQVSGVLAATKQPTESTFSYDITNKRPGGGPWTWTDINQLTVRAYPKVVFDPVKFNQNDGDWLLNALWAEVDHGPGYDMNIEFHWQGIPASANHNLELNYLVDGGSFRVQIWDSGASTWYDRGSVLNSASLQPWTLAINANEWNNGDTKIRFRSLQNDPGTPANLHIEYARVTS